MVNTRSSQGVRKRRRSSTGPPSDAGSIYSNKIRKTARRRFTTAEIQLQEEDREASIEREASPIGSREVSEQLASSSGEIGTSVEVALPTKSRQARYSLPANLQVPDNIKFESLRTAIARRNEYRRRQTEGLLIDGTFDYDEDANIYVDPADLDVDADQVFTPSNRSMVCVKHTPMALTTRPTPNARREDEISEYEDTIHRLTEEKANLAARLQVLELRIRTLGFGELDMDDEDICATLRTEFDLVRAQEKEMAIDVPIEDLSNQELLHQQPDIIRGLLLHIQELARRFEEAETHLAFSNAEYKGVLGKLAEREERNDALEKRMEMADQHLDAKTRDLDAENNRTKQLMGDNQQLAEQLESQNEDISSLKEVRDHQADDLQALRATCDELRQHIEDFKEDLHRLEEEHGQQILDIKTDKDERLNSMVEELEQEHQYRQIAEDEIASKDAAYTSLQIELQQSKSDLEDTVKELTEANELIERQDDEIETLNAGLQEKDVEKQELEQAIERLEKKEEGLEEDIQVLIARRDEDQKKLQDQATDLDEADEQIETLEEQNKAASTEINKLRADVFGVQQERDQLSTELETMEAELEASTANREQLDKDVEQKLNIIEKLEDNIDALNKAMENLQEEKDQVIDAKNAKLDEHEAVIDQQARDIEALRDENLQVLAERDELRKALVMRSEDVRILRDINAQLLSDAEQDALAARDFVERKAHSIVAAKQALAAVQVDTAVQESTVVEEKKKVTVKKTVRDSGYLGSETDEEQMLLAEDGY
jgi:DNA repair exonuclease SbcCD ATPase subunit